MTNSATSEVAGPVFSFLTTAYRSEDTLPRTIEAVRAQTRHDWELVVVDNGYDDAIVAAAQPYLDDPRIHLVRQENKGAVGGTMAAADEATGRYVVPLNSDDAVEPEFCARTAAVLEADPGIAAVTCDAHLFVDPGEERMTRSYLESAGLRGPADPARSLRVADVIDGPCPYYGAAIRRDVWEAMGGMASDFPMVDDLDFWLRVLIAGHDVRMLPDRLGLFRVQAGSESRPTDPERTEAFEAQREQALSRAAERSGEPDARAALDRVLGRLHYEQSIRRARQAFAGGDMLAARTHADAAVAARPTARSRGLALALRVAPPRVLAAVHPLKRTVQARLDEGRHLGWGRLLRGRPHRPSRENA